MSAIIHIMAEPTPVGSTPEEKVTEEALPEENDPEDGVAEEGVAEEAHSEEASSNDGFDNEIDEMSLERLRAAYLLAAANAGITTVLSETKEEYAARWKETPSAWEIAEEGKLDLADSPDVAVKINDEHRRADVADGKGSGLWTVDQLKEASPRVYKFETPTFAPPRWGTTRNINQTTYSANFEAEFPEIAKVLPMANVMVAGGAAAWPLGDQSKKASDVDFFLYGLPADNTEQSRKLRWSCIGALVNKIREQFSDCIVMLSAGVITLKANRSTTHNTENPLPPVKIQIILRAYPTVSSVVHGFDVPSCCVAYDGHIACMTYLAAYAHMFHANVVVPAYRSTTYESRLQKYFDRGYALIMPHLNMALMKQGEELILPNLALSPVIIRGRFAAGSVIIKTPQPESDYSFAEERRTRYSSRWRTYYTGLYGQPRINLKMVVAGRPVIMLGAMTDKPTGRRRRRLDPNNYGETGLPFTTFWKEPTQMSIFPREELESVLKETARSIVSKYGKVDVTVLRNILGLSGEQIAQLTQEVSAKWETARLANLRIDVSPSLEPFCAAILAKYDATPNHIDWWILADPTRQHTASINPRCEDPAQWYGPTYAATTEPPSSDEVLQTIIGVYEARMHARDSGLAFDGQCSICHDAVLSGDNNSITMTCGHVFHWATTFACGGLSLWVITGNRNCPLCRADILENVPSLDSDPLPIYINTPL